MCGISGFTWEDKDLLKRMNNAISYRGPDDNGVYTDKYISLAHNRLSIIDLSQAGHQPMSNKEGTLWIVHNGEIYNYKEIKADLEKKGYDFISNTDTEVIIYAYQEHGVNCLNQFNGMFSFAIWDVEKRELFLARDRVGIKPLYYIYNGKNLIFGSEIKALLQHKFEKQIDLQCLNSFLTYKFIPSSKTLIKGIKKLPPAHYAVLKDGNLTIKKYWSLNWKVSKNNLTYFISRFDKILVDSVKRRLISDVPLGAFLSGGLDSSLVVAINSLLRDDPVETFTVGFGHKIDEFSYAQQVSDILSTNHHEILLDYSDITKSIPKVIWHMDEPNSDITMIPIYFLSEFARKNVTVVNTGEGADELFSGYAHYNLGAKVLNVVPSPIKNLMYQWYYSPFKRRNRLSLLKISAKDDKTLNSYLHFNDYPKNPKEFLNKILFFDIKNQLPNWQLNRVDRMTMAHGMEARVPFLDHNIVEFSSTLPINFKQQIFQGKFILKKLALKYLPKEIVFRKKRIFPIPLHSWIKDNLEDIMEEIFFANKKSFFNYDYIQKLIKKHKASKKQKPFQLYSMQLLILLFFDIWYEMFINDKSLNELQKFIQV